MFFFAEGFIRIMSDSITGHAGIRILEIPDLRGISMENYVSKMDIRCLKKCRKRNTLEDTKLKMQLKVDKKVRDIFSNNLKVHEEATAKKLMKFRMAWDDIHPRHSPGRSLLQVGALNIVFLKVEFREDTVEKIIK